MPGAAPRIHRERVRRAFGRAAATFATHDFLYREMARRMDERLDVVRITPQRILDAGCGLGADRGALQKRYPEAAWIGLDQSEPMLRRGRDTDQAARGFLNRLMRVIGRGAQNSAIVARMEALPVAGQSIDLIWSNAALHWLNDIPAALKEFNRVLKVGGVLMFSTFGPDTLKELRQAVRARGDAPQQINQFTDMHDIGDMLVHGGFADPVMDMETLTLTYADPWQALRELQRAGSTGATRHGLTSHIFWQRVFENWPRDAQGRYSLTFELVQGHAWKVAPRQHEDGRAVVNFMARPGQAPQRG